MTLDAAFETVLDLGELIALARKDFGVFMEPAFAVLHDGASIDHASYLDVIVDAVADSRKGGSKRLIINMPPGHMKSMVVSVIFPAWLLGVDPTTKIMCACYGDDLTHKLSRLVRKLMTSTFYRTVFPDTILDKKAEDLIETTKGGERYATAINSDIAGFRADLIIVDDPMQPDDTASELAKQKVRDWYDGNVAQRLRDDKGVIVLVMHRLAPDDLTGTFLERGGWRHLSFPLICEDESATWLDAKGRPLMERARGDILNPARMTPEAVEEIRSRTPPHIFEAQYQQNPRFGGSGICSVDRFVRYAEPPSFELIIHSWDLAGTRNGGDWTVCAKFGLAKNQAGRDILCLFQVIRLRVELPDVRQLIIREDAADKPALICLDANALGLYIFQDLHQLGYKQVTKTSALTQGKSNDLKLRRFYETFPLLYDGLIQIPDKMTGQEVLLREFAEFPEGKHDDQVDALSAIGAARESAIRLARQNAEKFNRYLPDEAARRREAQRAPAPPRIRTTWYTRNGG